MFSELQQAKAELSSLKQAALFQSMPTQHSLHTSKAASAVDAQTSSTRSRSAGCRSSDTGSESLATTLRDDAPALQPFLPG